MTSWNDDLDPFAVDWSDDTDEPQEDATALMVRLSRLASATPWFGRLGEAISARDRDYGGIYCGALGFPHADLARIIDWEQAAIAADSADWDNDAWSATEQLRAALTNDACAQHGEAFVTDSLEGVTAYAAKYIQTSAETTAELWGLRDTPIINAASGAALKSLHNAALVLLAGEGGDHPLSLEYRLFELGRWPVALTGATFHLF